MKYFFFLFMLTCCQTQVKAQDDLDIGKMIQPVDSTNIFSSKDYYTWGASVVQGDDGKYHMFYSRWPHGRRKEKDDSLNYIFDGFAGWNKYSEIAYAVADHITGPYRHVKTILKGTGNAARWDRFTYHNPHVRKFNGYYYLYFISNAFDSSLTGNKPMSASALQWYKYNCTQKIGVIKAKTIEALVSRSPGASTGSFIMEPDNKQTFEVTNNPGVTEGPDGKYYMMYKSRKPVFGHMTFWMAVSNKPDGPFTTISPVMTSAETSSEDPCVWYDKKRKRFYAVAKYFSNSLKLAPQFGAMIVLTSSNGIDWRPAKHTLATLKEIRFRNGDTIKLANLERPFIVTNKKGQPIALFAAAAIKNPRNGDIDNVTPEYNTFNVHIRLEE